MKDQIYDNPIINVNGFGFERLVVAMSLLLHEKAVGWSVQDNKLTMYWTPPKSRVTGDLPYTQFIAPHNHEQMAGAAWTWLESLPNDAWEPTGDSDIWLKRGWRVYVEPWGHANGLWEGFVTVEPYSLWVGK